MRDYKKYDVFNLSHQLTLYVYKNVMNHFPKSEQFELASQVKRAAYSIPLNIVEGCGRNSDKDFAHFLDNSLGSTHELEYACFLSFELGYLPKENHDQAKVLISEVKAKLINLIKTIRKNQNA